MTPAVSLPAPRQRQGVEVSHVFFPACTCGHAMRAHRCEGWHPLQPGQAEDVCTCMAYAPAGTVEESTSSYRPWDTTRGLRRLACRACWWAERTARHFRKKWERRA